MSEANNKSKVNFRREEGNVDLDTGAFEFIATDSKNKKIGKLIVRAGSVHWGPPKDGESFTWKEFKVIMDEAMKIKKDKKKRSKKTPL